MLRFTIWIRFDSVTPGFIYAIVPGSRQGIYLFINKCVLLAIRVASAFKPVNFLMANGKN